MADTKIIYCEGGHQVVIPNYYNNGDIGLFIGGWDDTSVTVTTQSFDIPTATYQENFGTLQNRTYASAGCSNSIDSYSAGSNSDDFQVSPIETFNFLNGGSSTIFGNLTGWKSDVASCSDGSIALWIAGRDGGLNRLDDVEYVNMSSASNGAAWGTLLFGRFQSTSSADETTGLVAGGFGEGVREALNEIESFIFASGGQSTDFGDLTVFRDGAESTADKTQMIIASGVSTEIALTSIDRVVIDSSSNATEWGNLINDRYYAYSCGNDTQAIFGGGDTVYGSNTELTVETIDYASGGTATSYATMGQSYNWGAGASGGSTISGETCDDTTIFNLYSYITLDKLEFDSNIDNILLLDGQSTDAAITINNTTTSNKIDVSVNNIGKIDISNSIFNTGKTIYYSYIPDIVVSDLTVNTKCSYHTEDFISYSIDKSKVFLLDMNIITTMDNSDKESIDVDISDTFVNTLNIVSTYINPNIPLFAQETLYILDSASAVMALTGGGGANDIISKLIFKSGETSTNFGTFVHTVSGWIYPRCFSDGHIAFWVYSDFIQTSVFAIEADSTNYGSLINNGNSITSAYSRLYGATAGGKTGVVAINDIQKMTLASDINSTYWCDLRVAAINPSGAANETTILWSGGWDDTTHFDNIDSHEWSSDAATTQFGTLTSRVVQIQSTVSTDTMVLWGGGENSTLGERYKTIEKSFFASSGNSTQFSDLRIVMSDHNSTQDSTTGLFMGGVTDISGPGTLITSIDSIEFETEADSTEFGSLTHSIWYGGSCSGC